MREPFQALVILYTMDEAFRCCVFRRKEANYWQFLSGGKENSDRDLKDTVVREVFEETGLRIQRSQIIELETTTSISAEHFRRYFGEEILLVTEKCFAVRLDPIPEIQLSEEHSEFRLLSRPEAEKLLKWDSNHVALYELTARIRQKQIPADR